jgi:hypothetical protein
MQAPMRGNTYVTKWDANKSFNPINTEIVCDVNCGPFIYNEEKKVIAIGASDGRLIFVDAKYLNHNI